MKEFRYLIKDWYIKNKRDLPWRNTKDPYKIWVSEIILQQTRVEQGFSYYGRFVERFSDIGSLAGAEEEEVMKTWQGLGYYSRARNMHQAARQIVADHKGVFPSAYGDIMRLQGIGDYSAGAISSIAFGQPYPAIDGNVLRVLARFLGIRVPVRTAAGIKMVRDFLGQQMDREDPGTFNQALMELGALVCKPGLPACSGCPLKHLCFAFRNELTGILPVQKPLKTPSVRFLHYFVIISRYNGSFSLWLNKRTGDGIWKNLYDFPLIESEKELTQEDLEKSEEWPGIKGPHRLKTLDVISAAPYLLTHRELRARFFLMRCDDFTHKNYLKVNFADLHKYPVPRLIENILKKVAGRPGIFFKFPD